MLKWPEIHFILNFSGKENLAQFFIEKGANIHLRDKKENTPLHLAANAGNFAAIWRYFWKVNGFGWIFIFFSGAEKIVEMLIGTGAKVHSGNFEEATPLHQAAATTAGNFSNF